MRARSPPPPPSPCGGLAIREKAFADDPPVPDFRNDERVEVSPRIHEVRCDGAPAWAVPLGEGLLRTSALVVSLAEAVAQESAEALRQAEA